MKNGIPTWVKASIAAAIAGLGALGTAVIDDSVTASEWIGVASTTLVALGYALGVPIPARQPKS